MQTILAFKFDEKQPPRSIMLALSRVENHYYPSGASKDHFRNQYISDSIGLIHWTNQGGSLKWPGWKEDEQYVISTVYPPIGWERLIEHTSLERAPLLLARKLDHDPDSISEIDPPSVIAIANKIEGKIKFFVDGIGLGRLYEMRFPSGWVWSNRIGALSIFSGITPQIDIVGWQSFAVAGWFMGQTTPIQGAIRVRPSSLITLENNPIKPKSVQITNTLSSWVASRKNDPFASVASTANEITQTISSICNLWGSEPIVDLSGGRDSRVGAASIIALQKPAKFRTVGPLDAEVKVASLLLQKVGRQNDHTIVEASDPSLKSDLFTRVAVIHRIYDGDFTPACIKHNVRLADYFKEKNEFHIGGTGGEIAHGTYYSTEKWIAKIEAMGQLGPFERITSYLSRLGFFTVEARETLNKLAYQILEEGRAFGVAGITILDYFYLIERLRRWAPLSGHINSYSPFLNRAFIRATFDMSPSDRMNNMLHRQLIKCMVPSWDDVPFYGEKPTDLDERTIKKTRLWQTGDKPFVEMILADSNSWSDIFDQRGVKDLWQRAKLFAIEKNQEQVFLRVIWRSLFDRHLQEITRSCLGK